MKKESPPLLKPLEARRANLAGRPRDHLYPPEILAMMAAAKKMPRHGLRNYAMIYIAFNHNLRASEVVGLQLQQFDFEEGIFNYVPLKGGRQTQHDFIGDEQRLLKRLIRLYPPSRYVFVSERGLPLTRRSFHHIVSRAGKLAEVPFPVHPHMLRHAKGHQMGEGNINQFIIQDHMGHRNAQSTSRYVQPSINAKRGIPTPIEQLRNKT